MKLKDWINYLKENGQEQLAEASVLLKRNGARLFTYSSTEGVAKTNFTYTFDGRNYGYVEMHRLDGLTLSSCYQNHKSGGGGSRYGKHGNFTLSDYREAPFCYWGEETRKGWRDVQHFLQYKNGVLFWFEIGGAQYYKRLEGMALKVYKTEETVFNDGSIGRNIQRWNWDMSNWSGHIHDYDKTWASIDKGAMARITKQEAETLTKPK